jgi:hypothetical protein
MEAKITLFGSSQEDIGDDYDIESQNDEIISANSELAPSERPAPSQIPHHHGPSALSLSLAIHHHPPPSSPCNTIHHRKISWRGMAVADARGCQNTSMAESVYIGIMAE